MDRTGWTLPVIYALTMEEVADLSTHWAEEPTAIECLRASVGWEPPPPEVKAKEISPDEWEEMKKRWGGVVAELNRR